MSRGRALKVRKHLLTRCVFCEVQFQGCLAIPLAEGDHWDEMCDQLYMDDLGHGFNGRPK